MTEFLIIVYFIILAVLGVLYVVTKDPVEKLRIFNIAFVFASPVLLFVGIIGKLLKNSH